MARNQSLSSEVIQTAIEAVEYRIRHQPHSNGTQTLLDADESEADINDAQKLFNARMALQALQSKRLTPVANVVRSASKKPKTKRNRNQPAVEKTEENAA